MRAGLYISYIEQGIHRKYWSGIQCISCAAATKRQCALSDHQVGDVITVFYGRINANDKRDPSESTGQHMVWAFQD